MTIVFENEYYVVFADESIRNFRLTKKDQNLLTINLYENILDTPGILNIEIHTVSWGTQSIEEVREIIKRYEIAEQSAKDIKELLTSNYSLTIK